MSSCLPWRKLSEIHVLAQAWRQLLLIPAVITLRSVWLCRKVTGEAAHLSYPSFLENYPLLTWHCQVKHNTHNPSCSRFKGSVSEIFHFLLILRHSYALSIFFFFLVSDEVWPRAQRDIREKAWGQFTWLLFLWDCMGLPGILHKVKLKHSLPDHSFSLSVLLAPLVVAAVFFTIPCLSIFHKVTLCK